MLFPKTDTLLRQINDIVSRLSKTGEALLPYADCIEPARLSLMAAAIREKTEDFFGIERRFNLAVIGQVKAGKSFFLNRLLFGGKNVLPSDYSPKTAVPTRICFACENRLEVSLFTREDIKSLKALSEVGERFAPSRLAGQILRRIEKTSYIPAETERACLMTIPFGDYTELSELLSRYVDDEGSDAPLVKEVSIYLNLPVLKDIVVVDTPGLNDYAGFRSGKTRAFIETCDAAFFLSKSTAFLDETDMSLLTDLLPRKGVSRLCLVASQFDSALIDASYENADITKTIKQVKRRLSAYAADCADKRLSSLAGKQHPPAFMSALDSCRSPMFVSAMIDRISCKKEEERTESEKIIMDALFSVNTANDELINEISGFDKITGMFAQLVEMKDSLLENKASEFIILIKDDVRLQLNNICDELRLKLDSLDTSVLKRDRRALTVPIARLAENVTEAVSEFLKPLEQQLDMARSELDALRKQYREAKKLPKAEITSQVKLIHDSVFYKPWTWGKIRYETEQTEQISYYFSADEVVLDLEHLSGLARSIHTRAFSVFSDMSEFKNALYTAITSHNGLISEQEGLFTMLEERLYNLSLSLNPSDKSYSADEAINMLKERFPENVDTVYDMEVFKGAYASVIDRFMSRSISEILQYGESFKTRTAAMCERLTRDITAEKREQLSSLDTLLAARIQEQNRICETIEQLEAIA